LKFEASEKALQGHQATLQAISGRKGGRMKGKREICSQIARGAGLDKQALKRKGVGGGGGGRQTLNLEQAKHNRNFPLGHDARINAKKGTVHFPQEIFRLKEGEGKNLRLECEKPLAQGPEKSSTAFDQDSKVLEQGGGGKKDRTERRDNGALAKGVKPVIVQKDGRRLTQEKPHTSKGSGGK